MYAAMSEVLSNDARQLRRFVNHGHAIAEFHGREENA